MKLLTRCESIKEGEEILRRKQEGEAGQDKVGEKRKGKDGGEGRRKDDGYGKGRERRMR